MRVRWLPRISLLELSVKTASRCGLNRLGSRPAQCVRAPIRIRSVGVLVFPLHANSTGGDRSSTRAIWSSGVRERIAKPMPNGSSRGSEF